MGFQLHRKWNQWLRSLSFPAEKTPISPALHTAQIMTHYGLHTPQCNKQQTTLSVLPLSIYIDNWLGRRETSKCSVQLRAIFNHICRIFTQMYPQFNAGTHVFLSIGCVHICAVKTYKTIFLTTHLSNNNQCKWKRKRELQKTESLQLFSHFNNFQRSDLLLLFSRAIYLPLIFCGSS